MPDNTLTIDSIDCSGFVVSLANKLITGQSIFLHLNSDIKLCYITLDELYGMLYRYGQSLVRDVKLTQS